MLHDDKLRLAYLPSALFFPFLCSSLFLLLCVVLLFGLFLGLASANIRIGCSQVLMNLTILISNAPKNPNIIEAWSLFLLYSGSGYLCYKLRIKGVSGRKSCLSALDRLFIGGCGCFSRSPCFLLDRGLSFGRLCGVWVFRLGRAGGKQQVHGGGQDLEHNFVHEGWKKTRFCAQWILQKKTQFHSSPKWYGPLSRKGFL